MRARVFRRETRWPSPIATAPTLARYPTMTDLSVRNWFALVMERQDGDGLAADLVDVDGVERSWVSRLSGPIFSGTSR